MREKNMMPLSDLLVMRRTLKAVQRGLPVPETLQLVEFALDRCDDDTRMLEMLIQSALEEDHQYLQMFCELTQNAAQQKERHCGE